MESHRFRRYGTFVSPSPPKPDEPLRVLLVEDSEADAELLDSELRGQGFDLHMERVATESALRNALDRPWDVVLADYVVPGFSGLGALVLVKERAPDLPVILVSGSVGDEALVAAMRAGASDYVLKDNLSRLASAIRRELRDAEAHRSRREAERVRRETEERFRFVVERTGEVLYRLRFDTMAYDYLSPGIEKLIGYKPEEINAMGFARLVTAVEGPTPAAHPRERLRMALETSRAGEFWADYEVRTKSGELRWLADHSFAWRDDEERLKGAVGVLSDITERRRRDAALRQAQQRLQHVVASSPAVLFSLRVEGRELVGSWVSENVERLLGFTVEEALVREWWAAQLHPEDRERVLAGLPAIFAVGQLTQEYRFRDKRGGARWLRAELRLLRDAAGNPLEVIGSWADVSARKEAELRLQESEEQYRLLFESNPHPMWVFDQESLVFLAVNDAAVRHYGYSREEFLAMTLKEIRPTEDVPGFLANHEQRRSVPFGSYASPRTWRHRKKDGTVFEAEIVTTPIVFRGHPARLTLVTDVTEKRNLEAQLLQSQKMESMGRLAGGVAHDFNNLLAVISGYGELLRRRIGADAQLRRYVDDIVKAAERAAGLTGQLLAFSRKQVLQLRILNLNVVVEETEKMLRRLIGEDVQLSTVFDDRLDAVRADFGQMQQVLMNLALNARDAMPQGGRLTIETGNLLLDETHARQHADVEPGHFVALAVSDTGHGMSADTLGQIFEPFFTTKEPGKGTGLGLATVHGIVKQSGGHIWVESEPGHGTTFKICLPRADGSEKEAPPAPAATDLPRGSETILLAEDDANVRELLRECLDALGYTVLEARGGAEALALSRAHGTPIHLLITDVVMPQMSGRELANRLRASRPEARALYISGYTDDAVVIQEGLTEDMAFLQKPFTIERLSLKVREVLDRASPAER
jgi:hypothetical protein